MVKKKTYEDYIHTIFFVLFVLAIIGWLIWTIYITFWLPEKDNAKTIRFEVTGISNSENASTLVQIHYECMKYCMGAYSSDYVRPCWDQCALLGMEGCK